MPRAKGGSIPPPRVMVPPGHGGLISTLNVNDVLSGRGGRINNHPGNITFRTVVEDFKHEYLDPRTRKLEKAHVAARLVAQVRSTNPPGRFLREDGENPGMYVEIGDQKAWKKAGQALREDAPDVRKEIDEEVEDRKKQAPRLPPPPPPSATFHHQQQQRPYGVPSGIPPSVSYSPSSQPMPLAPPQRGGDPPEAPGVTGYRQAPLRYGRGGGRGGPPPGSGRGGGRGGGHPPGPFSGRGGRGGPPPQQHHPQQQHHQQQYSAHPQQGYHPQPAYYGHPPPPGQHYPPPGPPPGQFHPHTPQFQQHPPPHPYIPQHPHQNGAPPPQFTAPQPQDNRKKTSSSGIDAVAAGVNKAMDEVAGFANKVIRGKPQMQQQNRVTQPPPLVNSRGQDFPLTTSVGTDFTISEISAFGDSRQLSMSMFTDSLTDPTSIIKDSPMKESARGGGNTQPMPSHKEEQVQHSGPGDGGVHQGVKKQSTTSSGSKSSSGKSGESFRVSDLLTSNGSLAFSFGHSGRTRSFPDLMLSTGDLLPPLHNDDSDREGDDLNNMHMHMHHEEGDADGEEVKQQRTSSGRLLKTSFHRHSSSESSNHSMASLTLKGFHPVRGRANTAMSGMNINDAMSIMSLDSRKSVKSETSSWLDNFRSMQSIHSDTLGDSLKGCLPMRDDDGGSVRSFLSDVSNDLNALDLAGPLLPPLGLNDSAGDFFMGRPDP